MKICVYKTLKLAYHSGLFYHKYYYDDNPRLRDGNGVYWGKRENDYVAQFGTVSSARRVLEEYLAEGRYPIKQCDCNLLINEQYVKIVK